MSKIIAVTRGLPWSRAEARELGVKTYFTGTPCKHGHRSERRTFGHNCIACEKIREAKRPRKTTRRRDGTRKPTGKMLRLARDTEQALQWLAANGGKWPVPLISKDRAIELGLKRYFTGRPCRYGHFAERYVANHSKCVTCVKETKLRFRRRHFGEDVVKAEKRKNASRAANRRQLDKYRIAYQTLKAMGVEIDGD